MQYAKRFEEAQTKSEHALGRLTSLSPTEHSFLAVPILHSTVQFVLVTVVLEMYDAIVLGLGAVGSQALRGLARQGQGGRFLGVEGYKLAHSFGSSHGKTRIYRCAYFEHPGYVQWCQKSVRVFHEMEREHQACFVKLCGTLLMEASKVPHSKHPATFPPMVQASYQAAAKHNIAVEHLDAGTLRERFPQFAGTDDMVGLYEPGAGFVRCEQVTQAAQVDAQSASHVEIMEETRKCAFNTAR
jgi:sarcosine oxidase